MTDFTEQLRISNMTEVENEQAFSKYLKEWVNSHYSEWYDFYHDVRCNRRSGISKCINGMVTETLYKAE